MSLIDTFTNFELLLLFSVLPAVFLLLWSLIFGDIKNFPGSHALAYTNYTATDPVNCYQNYAAKKKD